MRKTLDDINLMLQERIQSEKNGRRLHADLRDQIRSDWRRANRCPREDRLSDYVDPLVPVGRKLVSLPVWFHLRKCGVCTVEIGELREAFGHEKRGGVWRRARQRIGGWSAAAAAVVLCVVSFSAIWRSHGDQQFKLGFETGQRESREWLQLQVGKGQEPDAASLTAEHLLNWLMVPSHGTANEVDKRIKMVEKCLNQSAKADPALQLKLLELYLQRADLSQSAREREDYTRAADRVRQALGPGLANLMH